LCEEALTRTLKLESEYCGKVFVVEREGHVRSTAISPIEYSKQLTTIKALPKMIDALKDQMVKIVKKYLILQRNTKETWCNKCRREGHIESKCTEEVFSSHV
jgi:hypothetical protein